MARTPLVLLPPSEGKAAGGSGRPWAPGSTSFPELDDARRQLIAALATAMDRPEPARRKLLGVKGAALEAATGANRAVAAAPTRPAIERYTGVLYDALDAGSLPARERRRLREQVVVFSGLWGLVQPGDAIADYKLKMGAVLPPFGRLSTWWRPAVTEALAPRVDGRVVWDLLPQEHRAAWAPTTAQSDGAPRTVITVRFLDETSPPGAEGADRAFTTVNHWNKLLKGALVRHVLTHQLRDPDGLARFTHPEGYVYDPSLTEDAAGHLAVALVRPAR
ncbi:YaaA family protein [Rhabdothermincola salaria]|uniref:YaaA family protein n=1 Tax=Rhabdothermincola salaria TaxID=2903142 RepID=UPI001E62D90A|nr:peroxide stress protein YaaA [Rhabdothermincola salaria]MCD9625339.1 peroxide stress protein YaaA [Rhabdothermincola salaria]